MAEVGIPEAAALLGVSEDTVRRRLKRGELQGEKVSRPQGFTWVVDLDDAEEAVEQHLDEPMQAAPQAPVQNYEDNELMQFLRQQIEIKDGQIGELVHTLREMQTFMLPAPKPVRPWWRRALRL